MTTLLYLHGVGDDGSRRDWWDVLAAAADSPLPGVRVVAPDYADLLDADPRDLAPVARHPLTPRKATEPDRRRYRAGQSRRHADLMAAGSVATWPHPRRGFARVPGMIDAIGEKLVIGMLYEQVGRYIDDELRRRAILDRVLDVVPTGPVVIIGHSLGALVALEVIRHLPPDTQVSLLVTAASALARRKIPADLWRLNDEFPYDRVGGWVNVFNPADPVTRGLPIGLRFPQAIDVSTTAGFANHDLAACLADQGVARLIAGALDDPAHHRPPPDPKGELDLAQALDLAQLQMTWHMEQLLAAAPDTTVPQLTQFMMARRVLGERSALRSDDPEHHIWDQDHAGTLRHRVAEHDLPAVLVRLAALEPMSNLSVTIDDAINDEARLRVVADLGVPPSWLELARHSRADAAAVFKPLRRRGRGRTADPAAVDDDSTEPVDPALAASITASVRESLRPAAVAEAPDLSRRTAGLGDIRPACTELIARALTSHRLGMPAAGARERTVLSRLMVLLGEHRVELGHRHDRNDRMRAQLRRRAATVAASLSWLAMQGIGLQPAR